MQDIYVAIFIMYIHPYIYARCIVYVAIFIIIYRSTHIHIQYICGNFYCMKTLHICIHHSMTISTYTIQAIESKDFVRKLLYILKEVLY